MGFLSRVFGRKKPSPAMPFEAFLRQFADDPGLADRMIRESKQEARLMMAFCLACLYGGYTLTVQIRESIASLPHPGGSTSSDPFPFDAVAQEAIALIFYVVMAEHLNNADEEDDDDDEDDDDEDDDDDDNESNESPKNEKFEALKEARYLADSLAEGCIDNRPKDYFKGRLLSYSFYSHTGKNFLEEAANQVLKVLPSRVGSQSLEIYSNSLPFRTSLSQAFCLPQKRVLTTST